ncbi:MAG: hypothetical protein ACLFM0_03500 [Spirochaetales bacterium]
MIRFGFREHSAIALPYDLRHSLEQSGVLEVFESRPASEQHRDLVWLASGTDREARIDRIVWNMLRSKRYNHDRLTAGFAGPRTTG